VTFEQAARLLIAVPQIDRVTLREAMRHLYSVLPSPRMELRASRELLD
jgi:hypothetical protein